MRFLALLETAAASLCVGRFYIRHSLIERNGTAAILCVAPLAHMYVLAPRARRFNALCKNCGEQASLVTSCGNILW